MRMRTNRLEAISDGMIAIIITIMVLEMKVVHGGEFKHLAPLLPVFLSYVLSYVYLGIYWINHHHMIATCTKITGPILWANLHFLFWLSIIPFVTGWMGENHFAPSPVFLYGEVLFMASLSYNILQLMIIVSQGRGSLLSKAVGKDRKGKLTLLLLATGVAVSLISPHVALTLYALVAMVWIVPDRRIEIIEE